MASTGENDHGAEGEVLDYESDNDKHAQKNAQDGNDGNSNNRGEMPSGFGIYIRNIDHKV